MPRRLVVTICLREPGVVVLPVEPGERAVRLDARAIFRALGALVARRGLGDRVQLREACAGGCTGTGPNVSVTIYPGPTAGERVDQIAVAWKTYVYSLPTLDSLARVIAENLYDPAARRGTRPARSARPRRPRVC